MFALAQSLLAPCPCGHIINFEKSEFSHQKVQMSASEEPSLSAKCSHWTTLLTAVVFLWTAHTLAKTQLKGSESNVQARIKILVQIRTWTPNLFRCLLCLHELLFNRKTLIFRFATVVLKNIRFHKKFKNYW